MIKHAFSHDAQRLVLDAGTCRNSGYSFTGLSGWTPNPNLKSLELRHLLLCDGLGSSGFQTLTALNLAFCRLETTDHHEVDDLDLFSNFPCLTNLVMSNMRHTGAVKCIKVHGPQLLRLELDSLERFKIEIFSPKLKIFHVSQFVTPERGLTKLIVLSLDHAEISVPLGVVERGETSGTATFRLIV
ncbi:unnamed protein product [Linum trigynum]|uniref:Uncharacterized protein n=1 Tax=Linum trigynum TaxID=586398 RepID=A0AAV2FUX7_9ROSI